MAAAGDGKFCSLEVTLRGNFLTCADRATYTKTVDINSELQACLDFAAYFDTTGDAAKNVD